MSQMLACVRQGVPPMQLCLSWMLSRVGDALDALPGEELRVAVEEARKVVACPPLFSLFFSLIFIFIFFFLGRATHSPGLSGITLSAVLFLCLSQVLRLPL